MVTYSKMFYNIETNNITTIDNELSITSPRSMSLYISICLLMPLWWGSWCRWPGNNRVGASSKNRTIPILAYHIPIISYSPNFPKNPTVNSLKKNQQDKILHLSNSEGPNARYFFEMSDSSRPALSKPRKFRWRNTCQDIAHLNI
jgi:hypothetical protein